MQKSGFKYLTLLIVLIPGITQAETIYINDKVMIGIHQDNSVDSMIIKILPTGTPLEIIKREKELTHIKDPDGITGWINNKYLVTTPPAQTRLQQSETRIEQLESELKEIKLKSAGIQPVTNQGESENTGKLVAMEKENEEIKQLFQSERLKVGELQAKIAELKNTISQTPNDETLLQQIKDLTEEKGLLEKQLENKTAHNESTSSLVKINTEFDWKKLLTTIGISLLIGLIAGLYLLDLYNRSRHGGFRV